VNISAAGSGAALRRLRGKATKTVADA